MTDEEYQKAGMFGLGKKNIAYRQYFVGESYLNPVAVTKELAIFNVTFEPMCRNNWHIHHAKEGGGQILICVHGEGYYQEEGKKARKLFPGDSVIIPANVKHWHGASKDHWFAHLAIEVPGKETSTEWLEPVTDDEYEKLD